MSSTKPRVQPTPNLKLKIVVRRLPPDLPEHVFWKSVAPWVTRETAPVPAEGEDEPVERVTWSCFREGKLRRSGKDKDDVHSRAYITFKSAESLVAFHRAYDGWSFRDKQGNITQAVVEFAPYQRAPLAPVKIDARQGTIEEDADFLAFQEALLAPEVAPKVEDAPPVDKTVLRSTPLLDHLREVKAAERAARSRSRPHPSTSAILAPISAVASGRKGRMKRSGTPQGESSSSTVSASGKSNGKLSGSGSSKGKANQPKAGRSGLGNTKVAAPTAPPSSAFGSTAQLSQPDSFQAIQQMQMQLAQRQQSQLQQKQQPPHPPSQGSRQPNNRPPPQDQRRIPNPPPQINILLPPPRTAPAQPPRQSQPRTQRQPQIPATILTDTLPASTPATPNPANRQPRRAPQPPRDVDAAQRRLLGAALGGGAVNRRGRRGGAATMGAAAPPGDGRAEPAAAKHESPAESGTAAPAIRGGGRNQGGRGGGQRGGRGRGVSAPSAAPSNMGGQTG